jgi:hypothetical protein
MYGEVYPIYDFEQWIMIFFIAAIVLPVAAFVGAAIWGPPDDRHV